jgi:glycosyltransferase 2 family protein
MQLTSSLVRSRYAISRPSTWRGPRHPTVRRWVQAAAALLTLALVVRLVGTDAFVTGLRQIRAGSVAAALAIGFATTVCAAGRWCLVARRLDLRLPLATAIADYYQALFLNAVLPGGVLGDAHRAIRHGHTAGGVRAVVLERLAGQVVLVVVGAVVLAGQPTVAVSLARGLHVGPVAVIGAVLGLLAVAGVWWRRNSRRKSAAALAAVRPGRLRWQTWPEVAVLSVAALAGYIALFLMAARTAGSSAPIVQLLPLIVLVLFAMGLPVNVAGWGPREGAAALVFGVAGLGATEGLTIAVVYGALSFVACLPGAAVLVLRGITRVPARHRWPPVPEPMVAAAALVALLALAAATVGLGALGWLAGVAYAIAMCVALTSALSRSAATSLGPANRVTLVRTTLVGLVTALVAGGSGLRVPAVLVAVATLALVLDRVDGLVARRTGSVSALGARFDMEVDAFLILVLSVAVSPSAGAWVLAIGILRYAFGAAAQVLPWLRAPLPPSRAKKGVAGLQGAVLVLVSAGVVPFPATIALLAVALTLLLWSFGRDIVWLWRGRGQPAGAGARARSVRSPVTATGRAPRPWVAVSRCRSWTP